MYSTEEITQAYVHAGPLSKNSKKLKFSDKVALEHFIVVIKSLYQKAFVTGLFCPLNLTHIIPDGHTMVV